jgi:hypothetical protein
MRLITFVRFSFLSAAAGSAALFVVLQLRSGVTFSGNFDLSKISLDDLSKSWHLIAALLVGGGSVGMQQIFSVDKRLNGQWHWISKVKNKEKLLRVAIGKMTIDGVDKWKKRQEGPYEVIFGEVTDINGQKVENNSFAATEILVGRNGKIFYQWEYINGRDAYGFTRIKCQPKARSSIIPWWRSDVQVSGVFCMASSEGTGTIDFYRDESRARTDYDNFVKQLSVTVPA